MAYRSQPAPLPIVVVHSLGCLAYRVDGDLAWRYGDRVASVLEHGRVVFVADCEDFGRRVRLRVACLDRETGATSWTCFIDAAGGYPTELRTEHELLFVTVDRGAAASLYAVGADDGALRWQRELAVQGCSMGVDGRAVRS